MIENAREWLIKLFERPQKAEEDGCLLTATTVCNDAIEIDDIDIKDHYETLASNSTYLFRTLSHDMSMSSMVMETRFRNIVQQCQIFATNVWTSIAETRTNEEFHLSPTTRKGGTTMLHLEALLYRNRDKYNS
jgi:hypothetical protein